MQLIVVVAIAAMAGILLFALVVGLGSLAVRWLKLPAEPTEEALYEPPSPPIVPAGDPAAARLRAAARQAAARQGRRALAVLQAARSAGDLAEWIASCRPEAAAGVRSAAASVAAAAEQARSAFKAGDEASLAAAELAGSTASAQIAAMAAGLPDWRDAERRKLLFLSALLLASLALAAGAMCLR
jgi:hypothetical protein